MWSGTSGHLRVGVDLSYVLNSAKSQATVTTKIYWQSQAWGYGTYSGTASVSGSASGSHVFTTGSAYSETKTVLVWAFTTTVALSYSATKTFSVTGRLSGSYDGAAPAVSASITLPKRVYTAPYDPDGVEATRSTDTKINISWMTNVTSDRPVTSRIVQRRQRASDGSYTAWVTIATLGALSGTGVKTSTYTDTTTKANNRYYYRIANKNSGGQSGWATDLLNGGVSTTPSAPSMGSVTKKADGSVVITWERTTPYEGTGYEVSDNDAVIATVAASSASVFSYTDTDPDPLITHTYRVRAPETGGLVSAWSNPSGVSLLAAPNAPTGLSPNGTPVPSDQGAFQVSWVHNPVDTSEQTSAEYRVRLQGGDWSTGTVTTQQSTTLEPELFPAGSTVEWQVRTRGLYHPDQEDGFSPWSAVAAFRFASTPGVAINVPDDTGTVGVSALTVVWAWFQAEGSAQAAADVRLLQDPGDGSEPTLVETRSLAGAATSLALTTRLQDQTSYQLLVRGKSGDGLWSPWDEVDFSVAYPQPLAPELTVTWDDMQGVAQVSIFNPDPGTLQVLQVLIDADTGRPYVEA